MPTDQAEKLFSDSLRAPVNNLVVVVAIVALVIVVGAGFLIWKFAPLIIRQIQQQIDTNAKLTNIVDKLSLQAVASQRAAEDNNAELVKQTTVLNELKNVSQVQSIDFKAYQILVSDNMANHTQQVT